MTIPNPTDKNGRRLHIGDRVRLTYADVDMGEGEIVWNDKLCALGIKMDDGIHTGLGVWRSGVERVDVSLSKVRAAMMARGAD